MADYDFALNENTLVTNNWKTTDWIRQNAPEACGTVKGSNYATITDKPDAIKALGKKLKVAGFNGEDKNTKPYSGKPANEALA